VERVRRVAGRRRCMGAPVVEGESGCRYSEMTAWR